MFEPYTNSGNLFVCCERVEENLAAGLDASHGLGSHYHCSRCWGVSSMMGHESNYCKVYGAAGKSVTPEGTQIPRHKCCPGDCQLSHPEEFDAEAFLWSRKYDEQPNMWIYRDLADEAEATANFARKVSGRA